MPVSPADFEFYSRMTGQPIPNTPAGRMAIAPQVYNMRRGGGGFGRVLRGAAKGVLTAGALAGAGALALATQEEMAKTKAPQAEKPKDSVDLDADIPKTVKASALRDEADRLSASVLGTSRGSAMSAPDLTGSSQSQPVVDDRQYLLRGSDDERIGTAASPEQVREFRRNRISGQTVVPQADPSIANESRGAQLASTSEPTQPRVEVRQKPSSGTVVTDLSNQAAVEGGMPAKETNPELSEIRQQVEMYEGSPSQSPFQAGGAMEELRRQSMDVKALKQRVADLDVPRSIRDDVAVFLTGATGGQTAPQPLTQKQADTRIDALVKEGIEHLEGGKPSIQFPKGEGSKYQSMTLDPSGDINVTFHKGGKTYSYPQSPEGSAGFEELASIYNNPSPAGPAKKSAVDLGKQMVSDAGKGVVGAVLGLMGEKKINPRRQEAEQMVTKAHGNVKDPAQREKLVDFYMERK